MKFKVVGSNRQTGARVTMELEANNRATAERKAVQSGMEVLHIEQILEGDEPSHGSRHRGEFERPSGLGKRIALLVILAAIALLVFMYWDKIQALRH